MFDFHEELKYYDPGLETVEETLSGDLDKDMMDLMQTLISARPDLLAMKEMPTAETEKKEEEKEPAEA